MYVCIYVVMLCALDFSASDLRSCSLIFSILKLDAGDKLIQHNEEATFFSIMLKGTAAGHETQHHTPHTTHAHTVRDRFDSVH